MKTREITQFSRSAYVDAIATLEANTETADLLKASPARERALVIFHRFLKTETGLQLVNRLAGAVYNIKTVRVLADENNELSFDIIPVRDPRVVRQEIMDDIANVLLSDPEVVADLLVIAKKQAELDKAARQIQLDAAEKARTERQAAQKARSQAKVKRDVQQSKDQRDREIARKVAQQRRDGKLQVTVVKVPNLSKKAS